MLTTQEQIKERNQRNSELMQRRVAEAQRDARELSKLLMRLQSGLAHDERWWKDQAVRAELRKLDDELAKVAVQALQLRQRIKH